MWFVSVIKCILSLIFSVKYCDVWQCYFGFVVLGSLRFVTTVIFIFIEFYNVYIRFSSFCSFLTWLSHNLCKCFLSLILEMNFFIIHFYIQPFPGTRLYGLHNIFAFVLLFFPMAEWNIGHCYIVIQLYLISLV